MCFFALYRVLKGKQVFGNQALGLFVSGRVFQFWSPASIAIDDGDYRFGVGKRVLGS